MDELDGSCLSTHTHKAQSVHTFPNKFLNDIPCKVLPARILTNIYFTEAASVAYEIIITLSTDRSTFRAKEDAGRFDIFIRLKVDAT